MERKICFRLTSGAIVLLLVFFGVRNIALAGEGWNSSSMWVKSKISDGLTSLGVQNSIKTTNYGIGQRIGYAIDNPRNALSRAPSFTTNLMRGGAKYAATSITGQLSAISNYVGKSTGLWNVKPQVPNIVEVKNRNAATILTTISSRTEYFVTDKSTNKTSKVNESVFRSLMKNNSSPSNIK